MTGPRRLPVLLSPESPPRFPDPRRADGQGLVAAGGDLSLRRLLAAYRAGIFPWYDEGLPVLWWSPDPRALIDPEHLHVSRRLARRMRRGDLALTWNRCFEAVMECCAQRDEGTWILPEMLEAYVQLHRAGHAHSLEVWCDGELAGGVYGVQCGGLFAAESMFHGPTDMSKVALVALVRSLFGAGITLLDVQFTTPHLERMGAVTCARDEYLARVRVASAASVDLSCLEPAWD